MRRGFTTIELVVVMALIVIMSTVAMVSMGPALADARLRSGCRMVASALNYARSTAVARRTYTRVMVDKPDPAVSVYIYGKDAQGEEMLEPMTTPSGRFRRLPRGIEVTAIRKIGVEEEESYVSFTALGQSEDAAIMMTDSRGKQRTILVDAITGRCEIVKEQAQ